MGVRRAGRSQTWMGWPCFASRRGRDWSLLRRKVGWPDDQAL